MANSQRVLTIAVMLGLCGLAVVNGWRILQFSEMPLRSVGDKYSGEALHRWLGVPGLGTAALEASLARTSGSADLTIASQRMHELDTLLGLRPLSSTGWLSLAGMRLVAGEPGGKVLQALAMSWLAGPNEGAVMWQRAIFGLLQWDSLPSDAQRRVLRDLSGSITGGAVDDTEMSSTEHVLLNKSPETRARIAAILKVEGLSPGDLRRIGF